VRNGGVALLTGLRPSAPGAARARARAAAHRQQTHCGFMSCVVRTAPSKIDYESLAFEALQDVPRKVRRCAPPT
jgi:hypothetical protein